VNVSWKELKAALAQSGESVVFQFKLNKLLLNCWTFSAEKFLKVWVVLVGLEVGLSEKTTMGKWSEILVVRMTLL
jgi:hypothetical protein